MSADTRVTAVVVTHDRRELLAEALGALAAQTRPPDTVVVVDNASTDGTADLVRDRFPDADLLVLGANTGGAGGFAAGIARALDAPDTGLLWLMDDDTVPEPGALAALLDARDRATGKPALIASRVVWTDGRDHPMNTPRVKPGASRAELAAAAEIGCRPVRSASFVSVLVDAAAVRERGLPVADYFLWNDDFEYSTRLLRHGTGLRVRSSVVEHHTTVFGAAATDPGERFYFEVRNKAWMLTRSRSLSVPEKLLYGGATLGRWARLFVRSGNRSVLMSGVRRGLRDARRPPRSTEAVLGELGLTSDVPQVAP